MRLMSFVVALCGFALVLAACGGGSGDRGGGGRACYYEELDTIVDCTLYVGKVIVSDEWFEVVCPTAHGYKEGTNCPKKGSYVGHCRHLPGHSGEYHEYHYDYYDDVDEEEVKYLKKYCAEDDGVWVDR